MRCGRIIERIGHIRGLGGLAFQVLVGWLSDRFDRRLVLAGLGLGFAGIAVILVRLPRSLPVVLPTATLLGGFMSTLYPGLRLPRARPHAS